MGGPGSNTSVRSPGTVPVYSLSTENIIMLACLMFVSPLTPSHNYPVYYHASRESPCTSSTVHATIDIKVEELETAHVSNTFLWRVERALRDNI